MHLGYDKKLCADAEPSGEKLSSSALCAAAASGQGLFGERAGKPLLRVVDPKRARTDERLGEVGDRPREQRPGAPKARICSEAALSRTQYVANGVGEKALAMIDKLLRSNCCP